MTTNDKTQEIVDAVDREIISSLVMGDLSPAREAKAVLTVIEQHIPNFKMLLDGTGVVVSKREIDQLGHMAHCCTYTLTNEVCGNCQCGKEAAKSD